MRVFHIVAPAGAGAAGDMTQRSIKHITAPASAGATVSL